MNKDVNLCYDLMVETYSSYVLSNTLLFETQVVQQADWPEESQHADDTKTWDEKWEENFKSNKTDFAHYWFNFQSRKTFLQAEERSRKSLSVLQQSKAGMVQLSNELNLSHYDEHCAVISLPTSQIANAKLP